MYITSEFKKFLKEAKGNNIGFIDGKAFSLLKTFVQYQDMHTNELDGITIDRRQLAETVKLLDGELVKDADKVFVCKGGKRKQMQIAQVYGDTIMSGTLAKALDTAFYERFIKASSYASTDETRYFMCGVYLEKDGSIVGTDGRVLLAWFADERFKSDNDQIIKHDKMLNNLNVASILLYDSYIEFVTKDSIVYQVPFIKGQYPNYRRLISDGDGYQSIELTKELVESLLIAEKFADNKYHGVNVSNTGIKTISEHPYTDAIESDGWFDFNVDAIYLNKCIADVDARFGNKKYLQHKDDERMMYLEDDKKIILVMPVRKEG
jgi:hypothetical protein